MLPGRRTRRRSADKPARLEIQPVDDTGKETMPAQVIGGAPGEMPMMARFDLRRRPASHALHVADRGRRHHRSLGAVAGRCPDLSKQTLVLSTPKFLRARNMIEFRAIEANPTASPTASTRFGATDRVLVEIEYQALGGQTPQIKVELLNAKGDLLQPLPTPPLADGRVRMVLPVGSLANSTYVLRIEATAGEQTHAAMGGVPGRALIAQTGATLTRQAALNDARASRLLSVAAFLGSGFAAQTPSTSSTATGEWPTYGGDLANSKYSPLDQITAANFGSLKVAWRAKSPDAFLSMTLPDGTEWSADSKLIFEELSRLDPKRWRDNQPPFVQNYKATPLMVGGTLYVNTPSSVGAAFDARTGALKWVYNPKSYEAGTTTMSLRWNQRGVGVLDATGNDERIYWGTGDGYLIAVDAKTGRPVPGLRRERQGRFDGRPAAREARHARLPQRADLLGAVTADRRQGHGDHAGGDLVVDQDQGTDPRLDSRLRCAHRQGAMDVPADSAEGRVRQRHLAGRIERIRRQGHGVDDR